MIPTTRPSRAIRGPRRWAELAARADDPEVQRLIHRAIRAGAIRVVPGPDGGICVVAAGRRAGISAGLGPLGAAPACPAIADGLGLTSPTSPARP